MALNISDLAVVNVSSPPEIDIEDPPIQTFKEIWEQDAQWIIGRPILAQVVRFLEHHRLKAEPSDHGVLNINLPCPAAFDATSGDPVNILDMVPGALKDILSERVTLLLKPYAYAVHRWRSSGPLRRQMDSVSLLHANYILRDIDHRLLVSGTSFQERAMIAFGLTHADLSLAAPFEDYESARDRWLHDRANEEKMRDHDQKIGRNFSIRLGAMTGEELDKAIEPWLGTRLAGETDRHYRKRFLREMEG